MNERSFNIEEKMHSNFLPGIFRQLLVLKYEGLVTYTPENDFRISVSAQDEELLNNASQDLQKIVRRYRRLWSQWNIPLKAAAELENNLSPEEKKARKLERHNQAIKNLSEPVKPLPLFYSQRSLYHVPHEEYSDKFIPKLGWESTWNGSEKAFLRHVSLSHLADDVRQSVPGSSIQVDDGNGDNFSILLSARTKEDLKMLQKHWLQAVTMYRNFLVQVLGYKNGMLHFRNPLRKEIKKEAPSGASGAGDELGLRVASPE